MAAGSKSSTGINVNSESESMEAITNGRNLASDHSTTHTVQNSPNNCDAYNFQPPQLQAPAMDLLMSVSISAETYKQKIIDLAFAASEELREMAQEQEPLWVYDETKKTQVLNDVEYKKRFAPLDGSLEEIIRVIASGGPIELPNLMSYNEIDQSSNNGGGYTSDQVIMENGAPVPLETEASKAIGVVTMSPERLVNIFMDVDQWSSVFSNMVSQATNLGILLTRGPENPDNGILQVMIAEYHVSSPLDQGREIYFARYCRQLAVGTWLVADVSLESVFPNPLVKCLRRPSGCLIQALQDGTAFKVTWVENNAVSYGSVQNMFRSLVASGFAFSANRWVATLESYCQRISILERQSCRLTIPNNNHGLGAGKESLLKVAGRMLRSYHADINSCPDKSWKPMPISGAEDILIRTTLNLDDPGIPRGVAVNVATSIWLPLPQHFVFDFLRNGSNRSKWDLLSQGRVTRDTMSFPTSSYPGCEVSVVLVEAEADKIVNLYLQESFADSTGCYVVYAPIDIFAMHHMMEGKNPDCVAILPSGFAILPADGSSSSSSSAMNQHHQQPNYSNNTNTNGSILTIAFHVMDEQLSSPEYLPPLSVFTAYKIIKHTVSLIKAAVLPNHID